MNSPPKILIVDDDAGMRFFLEEAVRKEGYPSESAVDGRQALKALESSAFPIVLMDIKMPKLGGLPALEEMKKRHPDILVILMTAYGSRTVALEAIQKGAYDYFTKPFDLDEMRVVLKRAAERCRLLEELKSLRARFETLQPLIIGESKSMRRVMELVDKVAQNDITVLITGESGTGKELVARAIHGRSPRRYAPFVVVNCAAIPETLLEMELFGHEKGSFTGAHQQKPGRFELADGGTLFLDEIGELGPPIQSKILRVLQEREIDRVGGRAPVPVDVRFIAATNRDLSSAVSEGAFREDLYFRLNVFGIPLPALRDHPEDIPLLAGHLLNQYSDQFRKKTTGISPGAMERLRRHPWPGNVREMENVIQRAVVLAPGETIDEAVLDEILPSLPPPAGREGRAGSLRSRVGAVRTETEKKMIEEALERENKSRTGASRRLGISRKNLYNKMKKYGLLGKS